MLRFIVVFNDMHPSLIGQSDRYIIYGIYCYHLRGVFIIFLVLPEGVLEVVLSTNFTN